MPPICAAYNCAYRRGSSKDISYFRFPLKDKELTKQWVLNMKLDNWYPTKHSFLCSRHFEQKYIVTNNDRNRLLSRAIPTVFDFSSHPMKIQHTGPPPTIRSNMRASSTAPPLPESSSTNMELYNSGCAEPEVIRNDHAYCAPIPHKIKRRYDTAMGENAKFKKRVKGHRQNVSRKRSKVHFDENQVESHWLDDQRKIKPLAVPTIFRTADPYDGQTNVESLEPHEPEEVTFHKHVKIETVISLSNVAKTLNAAANVTQKKKAGRPTLSNVARTLNAAANVTQKRKAGRPTLSNVARTLNAAANATQKRKAGRPHSSKKMSTLQQRRTSARLSVCGRRKWTNFYKVEYETNTQPKKIQNKLRSMCPKEVCVLVERIPRHSVESTLEKGSSEKETSQHTAKIALEKGLSRERRQQRIVQSISEKSPSRERRRQRSVPHISEKGPSKGRRRRCSVQSISEKGPSRGRRRRRSVQRISEKGLSKEKIPRGSEQNTSEEAASKERIPRHSVQSTLEEGPSNVGILPPTVQSTSEENPSSETPSEKRVLSSMPRKKRSRSSTGTRPRKILRIDDESEETQVSCGLENTRDDAAKGEKVSGNCVVCNNYVEQGTMLATLTNVSKEYFHEKLNSLLMGQDVITVKEDGVLCSVCTRLLNYMDRIEVELSMLKTALTNCMLKKHALKQDSNSSGQNHHESSGTLYTQNLLQRDL